MDLGNLKVVITAETAQLSAGLATATALVSRFAATTGAGYAAAATGARATATAMNNLNMAGAGLARTSAAVATLGVAFRTVASNAVGLLKIAAPIAAIAVALAATIGPAMQFETAFTGVVKTVDATAPQLEELRRGILDMSRELPAAASEIAGVAEVAGQLGIQVPQLLDFTRVMIDLGESTTLSATQAATAMARFANIVNNPDRFADAEYWSRLGSAIVELGNNFATTETEIAAFANRIAGAGAVVGLTEGAILGIGAALSSVGIFAEAGGTAVSRVLLEIDSAVDTLDSGGSQKLANFASIADMTVEAFAELQNTDPAAAFVAFVEGLARVEEEGDSAALALESVGLQNVRVRDSMLRLAAAGGLLAEAIAAGNSGLQQNSALTDEATRRYETAAARVDVLRNNFNVMAIDVGTRLLPAFVAVVDTMIDFAQFLSAELSPGFNAVADGAVSIAQAFAPLTDVIGGLIGSGIVGFFELLGATIEGVGLAMEAFAVGVDVIVDFASSVENLALTAVSLAGLALVFAEVGIGATAAATGFGVVASAVGVVTGAFSKMTAAIAATNPVFLAVAAGAAAFIAVAAEMRNAREAAEELKASLAGDWLETPSLQTAQEYMASLNSEMDRLVEKINSTSGFAQWLDIALGLLPGVESEVLAAYEAIRLINKEIEEGASGAQDYQTNMATLGRQLNISAGSADFLVQALGLVDQAMGLQNFAALETQLRRFIDQNGNVLQSMVESQSAWERYSDAISKNTATFEDVGAAMGITGDEVIRLAEIMDIDPAGLLDPDEWAELSFAMQSQITDWGLMGDAVGLTASQFLETEELMRNVTESVGTLQESIEEIQGVWEATDFQTSNLEAAQTVFEETVVAFEKGEVGAQEYLTAMRDLTLAFAASGVSAQEAIDKQLGLLTAWLDSAGASREAQMAAAELAIAYGLIPETVLTQVAWEGQQALEDTRAYQLALEQIVAKVWIAEYQALDPGATFEEAAANLDLLELFNEGDYTAIINADGTQAVTEALQVRAALEFVETGDWTILLGINDDEFRAGIANALLAAGEITDEQYDIIVGADDQVTPALAGIEQAVRNMVAEQFVVDLAAVWNPKGLDDANADLSDYERVYEAILEIQRDGVTNEELGELVGIIAALQSKTVAVNVVTNFGANVASAASAAAAAATRPGNRFEADGDVLEFYRRGGIRENHVAQIAPRGTTRIWNEPETGGEAYIPLAPSKRGRSRAIWRETGRRLGMEDGGVLNFADGGVTGRVFSDSGGLPGVYVEVMVDSRAIGTLAVDLLPIEVSAERVGRAMLNAAREAAGFGEAAEEGALGAARAFDDTGASAQGMGEVVTREGRVLTEYFGQVASDADMMVMAFDQAGTDIVNTIEMIGQEMVASLDFEEFIRLMVDDFSWAEDELRAHMTEMEYTVEEAVAAMIGSGEDLSGIWRDVFMEGADATDILAVALGEVAESMEDVSDKTRVLRDAFDLIGGATLDAVRAQLDYLDAVQKVEEAIGDGEAFGTVTDEARDNYDALIRAGEAMQDYAVAMLESGISAEAAVALWRTLEEKFVELAEQSNLTEEQVAELVEALFSVPDEVIAEIAVEGLEAQEDVEELTDAMEILDGSDANPTVDVEGVEEETENVDGLQEGLDEVDATDAVATVGVDGAEEGEDQVEGLQEDLDTVDGTTAVADVEVAGVEEEEAKVDGLQDKLTVISETTATATIDADSGAFDDVTGLVIQITNEIDIIIATPTFDGDDVPFQGVATQVTDKTTEIDQTTATATLDADDQASTKIEGVQGKARSYVGEGPYSGVIDADDQATAKFQSAQQAGMTYKTTDYTAVAQATDLGSAVFQAAQAVGTTYKTTDYTAVANAIDSASAVFQAAQAVGTTFKTTDYTATAAATDMASAVFNAAAGVGRAFATTYTATANAIDNASGVFNRARGAAQSFAQNYTATMTTIHRTIHEFGGNVAAGATSAASSGKTTGGFNRPKAYGGFEARRFGSGGLDLANAHQPEFATASSEYWRIWKEPETGGESYIPHANDRRRPHALRVLEQTAALMGRRVIENNQGNFLGRAPVISTPGTVVVVQKGAVQLGVEVNQVDDQRIIDASRRAGEALVASMTSQLEGVR